LMYTCQQSFSPAPSLTGSSCRANGRTRAPNSRPNLVCVELARRAGPSPTAAVQHITVYPGVVYSLINGARRKLLKQGQIHCVLSRTCFSSFSRVCRGGRSESDGHVRFVGALVQLDTPQYLDMERCRCCCPRLPRAARIYSNLSRCHRDTCTAGEGGAAGGRTWILQLTHAQCRHCHVKL
jgi:hypothetical protein